jgi:hypothetical protein
VQVVSSHILPLTVANTGHDDDHHHHLNMSHGAEALDAHPAQEYEC